MLLMLSLLSPDEPPPFELINPGGQGGLLLVCDHASNRIPASLNKLGMTEQLLTSHIGWDPGAAQVARKLSLRLDAPLILSNYSRLVIDCNRWPSDPESIPQASAGIAIPGNCDLTEQAAACRRKMLFEPYQEAIAALVTNPPQLPRLLLSIHSFAPSLAGIDRPWSIGVCYRLDVELARRWLDILNTRIKPQSASDSSGGLDGLVGDNKPYEVEADCDYTIPVQGESRGIPSIMLELRQDKIQDEMSAQAWSDLIAESWLALLQQ
jgi:predicted N-formylglutamate amidohydrolase